MERWVSKVIEKKKEKNLLRYACLVVAENSDLTIGAIIRKQLFSDRSLVWEIKERAKKRGEKSLELVLPSVRAFSCSFEKKTSKRIAHSFPSLTCRVIDALYVRNTLAVRPGMIPCKCLFNVVVYKPQIESIPIEESSRNPTLLYIGYFLFINF